MSMDEHSFDVTWRFVVPSENTQRVVITQRQDGPFRGDEVGGSYSHYYVSREEIVRGQWQHATGSSRGAFKSYAEAHRIAEQVWATVKEEPQWR